jgi:hypothetical protein
LHTTLSPTSIPTDYSPSAFHSNFTRNATIITDDFAHGFSLLAFYSSLTRNATIITNDFVQWLSLSAFYRGWWKWHNHRRLGRRNPVCRHLLAVYNHRQVHRRTVWILKGGALNASLTACSFWQNYRRTAKNMEGN